MHQRRGQGRAQRRFISRRHIKAGHGQLDGVLLEAVQARKTRGRQEVAIDAQVREAARPGPVGQFGVDALAVHHERREQADVLAAKIPQELRGNAVGRLRRHRRAVMDAVLRAELDVQQPQKMPDLGRRAHGGLAPAPGQPLLDGHGRGNAVNRVDFRPTSWLHDGARIGVERFEIAPLTFVEQNVKGQRRFA